MHPQERHYSSPSDTDPGRREMLAVGRWLALVAAIAAGVVVGLWVWSKINGG